MPEIAEAGLDVALFAGELVIVGVVVEELEFAAPRVIVRLGFDHAGRIGNDRRGLQMVREVIDRQSRVNIGHLDKAWLRKHLFLAPRTGGRGSPILKRRLDADPEPLPITTIEA